MNQVNPFFLHELLGPLTGLADDDSTVDFFRSIDPNDPDQVRPIIRRYLVPYFDQLQAPAKRKAKLALSYYLSNSSANFARVFHSCLLPFPPPDDARMFFLWLWEELFPNENHQLTDLTAFREVPDIHEPNRY